MASRSKRRAACIAAAVTLALPATAVAGLTEEAGSPHAVGANPYWVATADFNDDGLPDFATANETAGTVTVLLRQPGGGYAEEPGSPIQVGERPDAVAVADFDQDDRQDLAVTNFTGNSVTILLRQAGGGFAEEPGSPVPAGARPHSVLATDINADGLPDLAIPDSSAGTLTLLLRQADGGFTQAAGSPIEVGSAPTQVAADDFDGDGRKDLAVADYGSDELTVLEAQPGGGYSATSVPAGSRPVSPVTGDFDHDGDADLAVTDAGDDDIIVYLHDSDGFGRGRRYAAGHGPYGLVAADFDGNGATDLAASDSEGDNVTVLLQQDAGGFAPSPFSPIAVGRMPLQLAAGDLDGDGRPDLAVPNHADSTVSVLVHGSDTEAPETTITAGPEDGDAIKTSPTFEFESSQPGSTFACTRTFAPGTLLERRTPFDCDSPAALDLTAPGEYRFSVRAINASGNADQTPAERTFTLLGPPPGNTELPLIVPDAGNPHVYRCDPGRWSGRDPAKPYHYAWQRLTPDNHYVSGYRAETVATTETYRAAASSTIQLNALSWRFQCVVEAANASGTTSATSASKDLDPIVDALLTGLPYGNVRIRGIDVFQVVQPNSGAKMYAFPKGAAFPAFPGGGTPTDWRLVPAPGGLGLNNPKAIDPDPQTVGYQGLTLDRHMPTTAVVYVDMQNAKAVAADQRLKVSIKVREGSAVLREDGRIITDPPVSTTPWVTAAERADKRFGVQFDISVLHGVTAGGAFTVEAKVEFDPDNTTWNARECDQGDCGSDDHFKLTGVKVDNGYANGELMIRAVDLFRPGQPAPPNAFDVLRRRTLMPNPLGVSLTDYGSARIDITAAVSKTAGDDACKGITLRQCRQNAVSALIDQYSVNNPARTFANGLVTRNYDVIMGVENYDNEPGWASGPNRPGIGDQGPSRDVTQITTQGPVGPAPRFVVNCCARPITAAAHEFGHILSAPHSDTSCGGPAGGGAEPWPDDMAGRLQGTRFTGLGSPPDVDGTTPLYDLMSYCADLADTTSAPGNAWISPFNWNRFAYQFTKLGERGLTRDARVFAQAAPTPAKMAFASGSVTATRGTITSVTPPDEDSVAPASVAGSALRLRTFDTDGRLLADTGVQMTPAGLPGTGTFGGPVPPNAARVELVRHGHVLDHLARSRAPRVKLLAAGRVIRWHASDPDGDPLTATIDASTDHGRHWRTIYIGPNTERARVPARLLPRTSPARLRISVSDGFNAARAG